MKEPSLELELMLSCWSFNSIDGPFHDKLSNSNKQQMGRKNSPPLNIIEPKRIPKRLLS